MTVTYKNFRGDVYYLHVRKTKKGNNTYYFSKKSNGNLAGQLPEEYEIYEEPNGNVYARRRTKRLITDKEIHLVEQGMRKHCPIDDFKLDIKKEFIYIYTVVTPNEDKDQPLFMNSPSFAKYKNYETVMRFELIDLNARIFEVQRYCFFGSIDDWIDLESSTDLEQLVAGYVSHIGQESFYDLI